MKISRLYDSSRALSKWRLLEAVVPVRSSMRRNTSRMKTARFKTNYLVRLRKIVPTRVTFQWPKTVRIRRFHRGAHECGYAEYRGSRHIRGGPLVGGGAHEYLRNFCPDKDRCGLVEFTGHPYTGASDLLFPHPT